MVGRNAGRCWKDVLIEDLDLRDFYWVDDVETSGPGGKKARSTEGGSNCSKA